MKLRNILKKRRKKRILDQDWPKGPEREGFMEWMNDS